MTSKRHITVILNPKAGRGKAEHIRKDLQHLLKNSTFDNSYIETSRPGDATTLAREASKTSGIVVAVGGDGTVNEVASGLVGTTSALAVLSEGSGNDFARMVSAPSSPRELLSILEKPTIKKFDSGRVRLSHEDGSMTEKQFFNSIGLGFDAAVAKKVSSIRWMRGVPLYLTALLHTIAGYQPHHFRVSSGKEMWHRKYFLLCIGNGKWEGGGFQLTPNAHPDDGMFEVCGVTGNSILKVLPILPLVMRGKHIGKRYIESFNSDSIIVESDQGYPVHGDGEIFGWRVKKAEISMNPSSLNVVFRDN